MAENLEKDNASTTRKPSTSLVTDVLLKSGRLEKEDINSCVKKTLQKSEEVKVIFYLIYIAGSSVDRAYHNRISLFDFFYLNFISENSLYLCFDDNLLFFVFSLVYFWSYSGNDLRIAWRIQFIIAF